MGRIYRKIQLRNDLDWVKSAVLCLLSSAMLGHSVIVFSVTWLNELAHICIDIVLSNVRHSPYVFICFGLQYSVEFYDNLCDIVQSAWQSFTELPKQMQINSFIQRKNVDFVHENVKTDMNHMSSEIAHESWKSRREKV